jgi:hypothetical protein
VERIATRLGTEFQVVSRFGLNQTRATMVLGGGGTRRVADNSWL